jgi:hypothetical protein
VRLRRDATLDAIAALVLGLTLLASPQPVTGDGAEYLLMAQ